MSRPLDKTTVISRGSLNGVVRGERLQTEGARRRRRGP